MPVVNGEIGGRSSIPLSHAKKRLEDVWTLLVMACGGVCFLAIVGGALFFVADTGDGFYSRNVSNSMAPALLSGDWITSRRLHTGANGDVDVHRGDLLVHAYPPNRSLQFIKRLVGLPGDTLAMVSGKLTVNGQPLAEPYAHRDEPTIDPVGDDFNWQRRFLVGRAAADTTKYQPSRNNWGPIVVPAGHYFVLGDNRDNSLDSRYFGFLTRSDLQGRVRRIYFSRDSTGTIRWSRIGTRPE